MMADIGDENAGRAPASSVGMEQRHVEAASFETS
jgi:hypothetical protein